MSRLRSCSTPSITPRLFPYGYGAGPNCTGLTPSQTNASIYGAPDVGPLAKGLGVNLAVFEISGYLQSDIDTWAHQFYGSPSAAGQHQRRRRPADAGLPDR